MQTQSGFFKQISLPFTVFHAYEVLLHEVILSCDLQRNTDESVVRQVADNILHACNFRALFN